MAGRTSDSFASSRLIAGGGRRRCTGWGHVFDHGCALIRWSAVRGSPAVRRRGGTSTGFDVIAAFVAGVFAGYGIAMPVGAVATFLVSLTARTSLRIGAAAGLGVASADGGYAVIAVVAGTSVAGLVRPVAGPLRIASGVALLGLAIRGAVRAIRKHRSRKSISDDNRTLWTARRAYLSFLGITLLNPATIVYFTALVLGNRASVTASVPSSVIFVFAVAVASASWQLLLACSGAVLGHWLTGPHGRLITALVSSVIIAALAIDVMFQREAE
jgi:arginine exporter protein ArgO